MEQPKQPNQLIKYSGLVVQMGVVIGLFSWGGNKLDKHYHTPKPYFTIVLSLLGIAAALYLVLRDFIKKDPSK